MGGAPPGGALGPVAPAPGPDCGPMPLGSDWIICMISAGCNSPTLAFRGPSIPDKLRRAATAFWPSGDSEPRPGSDCSMRSIAMPRLIRALSRVPIFGSGVAIGAAAGAAEALGFAERSRPPGGGLEPDGLSAALSANANYNSYRRPRHFQK